MVGNYFLQVFGEGLPGESSGYEAIPGKGLKCAVKGVRHLFEETGQDENIQSILKRKELVHASKRLDDDDEYQVRLSILLVFIHLMTHRSIHHLSMHPFSGTNWQ